MGVQRACGAGCNHEHSPTHAQVHHEHPTRIEVAQQILAVPTCGGDSHTREPIDDCFATLATHGALAKHLDTLDHPPHGATLDAATYGFDFG